MAWIWHGFWPRWPGTAWPWGLYPPYMPYPMTKAMLESRKKFLEELRSLIEAELKEIEERLAELERES